MATYLLPALPLSLLLPHVGKSSLLRVLAGLWPFEEGRVTRPLTIGPGGLFFLPQRPYLTSGTLRQQLLYPEVEQRVSDPELVQVSLRLHLCVWALPWGAAGNAACTALLPPLTCTPACASCGAGRPAGLPVRGPCPGPA